MYHRSVAITHVVEQRLWFAHACAGHADRCVTTGCEQTNCPVPEFPQAAKSVADTMALQHCHADVVSVAVSCSLSLAPS